MAEFQKIIAKCKMIETLRTHNGLDIFEIEIRFFVIGGKIKIYRENGGCQRPFQILTTKANKMTIETDNGPTTF
jgi:hypothetical protein